ncbi:MAG TPA: hypothetical protein VN030_08290 [Cellvibrio sp.]|nr:hypothetical protein [Cellvibrio sp.]
MKKFIQSIVVFIATLPLLLLAQFSQANSECTNGVDDGACLKVDEMTVTAWPAFEPYYFPDFPFPEPPPYFPGVPLETPQECQTIESDFAQCDRDAQGIYAEAVRTCERYVLGGSTIGAGGLAGGAAALALTSNPYGWALLAVGAVGSGAGAWGASSCYSQPSAIRDVNLSICQNNKVKMKNICGVQ